MDLQEALEMEKHLKKQNELLQDAHQKMSLELRRLQVEEEMLMRKFFELTSTVGLNKVEEEMLMRKFFELTSTLGLNKKNVMSTIASHEENEEPADVNIQVMKKGSNL